MLCIEVVTAVQVFHVKNVGASITLQRFISTGTTTQQQQMITQFSKQRTRRQGAMLNTHTQRRMAGSLGASSNLFLRLVQAVPICREPYSGKSCAKILPVTVFHRDNPNKQVKLYAVIDDQSNRSLAAPDFF